MSNTNKNKSFSEAIESASAWIRSLKSEGVLLIEAPLSGAFSQDGNPVARGSFETAHQNGDQSDRRWHVGAGGAMALAATHFLRLLLEKNRDVEITIHLVEGFLSRYGHPKPSHGQVAMALKTSWMENRGELIEFVETPGFISTAGLFDTSLVSSLPLVLRLADGFKRADVAI